MVITIIIIIGWEERIEYRMCAVHWAYLPTPLQPAYFVNRIWYFPSTRFTICLCIYYHHLFHIFHWNGYVPYTSYVRWILRERFPKKPKRNSYGKCHDFQRTWVPILLGLVSNSLTDWLWLTGSIVHLASFFWSPSLRFQTPPLSAAWPSCSSICILSERKYGCSSI